MCDVECSLRNKNVINASQFTRYGRVVVCIEARTSAVRYEFLLGTNIAVKKKARVEEQLIGFPSLYGIVVACYNNGCCRAGKLLNLLLYEIERLLPVRLIKVKVCVKVKEGYTSCLVIELAP